MARQDRTSSTMRSECSAFFLMSLILVKRSWIEAFAYSTSRWPRWVVPL